MTPQSFSYGTLSNNSFIYMPPYGLTECLDYMLKLNPRTYEMTKIPLKVDSSFEKWTVGIVKDHLIYFLPYNESSILVVDTNTDECQYVKLKVEGKGKYNWGHVYNNSIIALPYGIGEPFDYILKLNTKSLEVELQHLFLPINDQKKWHTTQMIGNKIYGVPRGERWIGNYFPYRIEYDCYNETAQLHDLSHLWKDIDAQRMANKKYTTLAKVGDCLYAPPYSENPNFDLMLKFRDGKWTWEHTGITATSRKYYSHTVAKNNKIYCPPAGHDEDWSAMLIIDSTTDTWYTKDLGIGKESKKYFAGVENSQGKIYYIPRGGCVCEPEDQWKRYGDLAEVLVIDTKDDSHYTIDVGKYFSDSTTIEKYNCCLIYDDKIFAFPYGESETFQTLLVFDTITEQVIKTIDLNDI